MGHDLSCPSFEAMYFRVKMGTKHGDTDDLFPVIGKPAFSKLFHEFLEDSFARCSCSVEAQSATRLFLKQPRIFVTFSLSATPSFAFMKYVAQ